MTRHKDKKKYYVIKVSAVSDRRSTGKCAQVWIHPVENIQLILCAVIMHWAYSFYNEHTVDNPNPELISFR